MNNDTYKTHMTLPNGNAIVSIAEDAYFMINEKGENILGTVYKEIWTALCLSLNLNKKAPKYYCVRTLDKTALNVGLIDSEGKLLIPPEYVDIWVSEKTDGLFRLYCPDGKIGFMYGGIIHKYNCHDISDFCDGYAVIKPNPCYKGNAIYEGCGNLINLKGETVFPDGQYINVDRPSHGVCAVSKLVQDKEVYGYVDISNNIKIPFQFEEALSFYRGFAKVKFFNRDNWNVIDIYGNVVAELPNPFTNDGFVHPFDRSIPESAFTASIESKVCPITIEESYKKYLDYKQYRNDIDSLMGRSVKVEQSFEIGYLEYYAAPYTGGGAITIPKGIILSNLRRMSDDSFYCDCSDDELCNFVFEEVKRKINGNNKLIRRFSGIGFYITYEQCIKFCSRIDNKVE